MKPRHKLLFILPFGHFMLQKRLFFNIKDLILEKKYLMMNVAITVSYDILSVSSKKLIFLDVN